MKLISYTVVNLSVLIPYTVGQFYNVNLSVLISYTVGQFYNVNLSVLIPYTVGQFYNVNLSVLAFSLSIIVPRRQSDTLSYDSLFSTSTIGCFQTSTNQHQCFDCEN